MSDITHDGAATSIRDGAQLRFWPLVPYACVVGAGAMGLAAGYAIGGNADGFDDRLALVLRFMAALKLVAVLGGAGLLHWRLRLSIAPRLATAYAVSLAAMAGASGLIWSLGGIVLGALLFHAGLIAFLILALRDDGVRLPSRR